MKHVWIFFMLSGMSVSCRSLPESQSVKELLELRGPPSFTAMSMSTRGNLLICQDLELFDPKDAKADEKVRGQVLLFCEPWDSLYLATALTDVKMRRAAPFLGSEGPGKKSVDEMPAKKDELSQLLKPARVFAAFIDKREMVDRIVEITVNELQLKD